MFCNNCGESVDDDAIYCNYCGFKIDRIEDNIISRSEESGVVSQIDDSNVTNQIYENISDNIEQKYRTIKGLSIPIALCIFLLIIGFSASIVNIIRFYLLDEDIYYIMGQMIFLPIFILSMILLYNSRKIGGILLISFSLFKMIGSAYYYKNFLSTYVVPNLVFDEIFYLLMIISVIVGWKKLE